MVRLGTTRVYIVTLVEADEDRPGNVSSAMPDLSSSPLPISTRRRYWWNVTVASGGVNPAVSASLRAIPQSFAACAAEK